MDSQFGTIRQLGFVVPDIEAAMRHWVQRLGVGPFYYIDRQPLNDFRFRGIPAAPVFSVALAQTGPIQIELIQQRNDEPSAFKEFAGSGREGLQHIAFWTEDFDRLTDRAAKLGYTELQSGRSGSGAPNERFAYFDGGGPAGSIVELSEVSGRKAELFAAVAAASVGWSGAEPIRDMTALVLT